MRPADLKDPAGPWKWSGIHVAPEAIRQTLIDEDGRGARVLENPTETFPLAPAAREIRGHRDCPRREAGKKGHDEFDARRKDQDDPPTGHSGRMELPNEGINPSRERGKVDLAGHDGPFNLPKGEVIRPLTCPMPQDCGKTGDRRSLID